MPQLMSSTYAAQKIYESVKSKDSFEITFPFFLTIFLKLLSILPYKLSLNITKRML